MADTLKKAAPSIVITETPHSGSDNVILNHKRPPFNNVHVRRAINLALDRRAWAQVRSGAMSSAMPPRPVALWGLSAPELAKLPGYREPARDKADARQLLAEAGFGPGQPLRAELATRSWRFRSTSPCSFRTSSARSASRRPSSRLSRPCGTRRWPAATTRSARTSPRWASTTPTHSSTSSTSAAPLRNSTDYCNPEVDRLIDSQSQELDPKKHLALVLDIQRRLEEDVAKPMLGWRNAYFARWPYVKNLVPHAPVYNFARMQDVWLDR
jgi:peptide/nickel transport system substrate-binding protein